MSDFFKGFNLKRGFSSTGFSKNTLTSNRTVCVKHKDGRITEYDNITNPWKYIAKVKKNMNVIDAWIKED